jgi:hypothetical protein
MDAPEAMAARAMEAIAVDQEGAIHNPGRRVQGQLLRDQLKNKMPAQ